MTVKILLILTSILITPLFAEVKGPIEKAYKNRYKELDNYKAMYVAIDFNNGRWVYGFASNHVNSYEAKKAAKKFCENTKKDKNINGYCKLYAIGNRVIGF